MRCGSSPESTPPRSPSNPDGRPRRVLTRNRMGWVSAEVSELSRAWVEDCRRAGETPVLDIGAAFGAACLEALATGARVIANDLHAEHLEELERRAPAGSRLTLRPAHFPKELFFEPETLHSVHISNVVHFLTGRQLERGLAAVARWLKPGGRLYLQAVTPFQAIFEGFREEYARRVEAGVRWPGYIAKLSVYARHRQFSQMPRAVHLLDDVVLRRAAEAAGLRVERCWLFQRADQPKEIRLDGRESVALIARAPEEAGEAVQSGFEYLAADGIADPDR
ncbi:MAG: class I SAM-dependent methyltransferase [Solibacteraceae bacterium]|nr:class I SAM-dependent methyltransferase [Solibacteraceae bacterium]